MTGIPLLFREKENVMHRKCSISHPEYLGHIQGGIKGQFYIVLCAHLSLKFFSPSTVWGIKKVKKPRAWGEFTLTSGNECSLARNDDREGGRVGSWLGGAHSPGLPHVLRDPG